MHDVNGRIGTTYGCNGRFLPITIPCNGPYAYITIICTVRKDHERELRIRSMKCDIPSNDMIDRCSVYH